MGTTARAREAKGAIRRPAHGALAWLSRPFGGDVATGGSHGRDVLLRWQSTTTIGYRCVFGIINVSSRTKFGLQNTVFWMPNGIQLYRCTTVIKRVLLACCARQTFSPFCPACPSWCKLRGVFVCGGGKAMLSLYRVSADQAVWRRHRVAANPTTTFAAATLPIRHLPWRQAVRPLAVSPDDAREVANAAPGVAVPE